jgi:hypothetical protein
MDKYGFENILAEFRHQSNMKPFARDLRNALVPIRDGAIFTGMFRNPGIMYLSLRKVMLRKARGTALSVLTTQVPAMIAGEMLREQHLNFLLRIT